MYQINIHEAKTQLSKLVEIASQGEEIIIAKAGKPIARLVPLENRVDKERKPGALRGRIRIAGDFDAPLTEGELAQWNDAPIFPKG
ncbi:MAG: type II toxin-antitoxin system Phd/YefM family antitoxin [Sulfuricella sp.]|nr:type II toxin-antitoxin system Phd/YefM family antitoxin [Sulfuricella sp.]